MADIDPSLASWAQTGGLAMFAGAVLLYLRDMRRELAPLLKGLNDTLVDVRTTLASMLERERLRAERGLAWEEPTNPQAMPLQPTRTHTPAEGRPIGSVYSQHRRKPDGER